MSLIPVMLPRMVLINMSLYLLSLGVGGWIFCSHILTELAHKTQCVIELH